MDRKVRLRILTVLLDHYCDLNDWEAESDDSFKFLKFQKFKVAKLHMQNLRISDLTRISFNNYFII